jgi:hypothetical protein
MPLHPLRSVIKTIFHTLEVIYPGHMQWKHCLARHDCLMGPILAQWALGRISRKSESGWLGRITHSVSSTQECHPTQIGCIGGHLSRSYADHLAHFEYHSFFFKQNSQKLTELWQLPCPEFSLPTYICRNSCFIHSQVSPNTICISQIFFEQNGQKLTE